MTRIRSHYLPGILLLLASLMISYPAVTAADTIRTHSTTLPFTTEASHPRLSLPAGKPSGDAEPELEFWRYDMEPVDHFDFGTIDLGSSKETHLSVMNVGGGVATGITLSTSSDFLFLFPDGGCFRPDEDGQVGTLFPGERCSVPIKMFSPPESGQTLSETLFVTSDQDAEAQVELTGTAGTEVVLYDQLRDWESTPPDFLNVLNGIFPRPNEEMSSELADDFLVTDPAGWTINKVGLQMGGARSLPSDVFVFPDDQGKPGEEPVCVAEASEFVPTDIVSHVWRDEIMLSQPCELAPGHFWLVISLHSTNFDVDWQGWGIQVMAGIGDAPGDPDNLVLPAPPTRLNSPVWRNFGRFPPFFECHEWTPLIPHDNCGLLEHLDELGRAAYGAVFWLVGQGEPAPVPELQVEPANIDFGAVAPGAASEARSVTLSSTGTGPIQLSTSGVLSELQFEMVDGDCPEPPFSLQPGESCTQMVVFSPHAQGSVAGELFVVSDAHSVVNTVMLAGEGARPDNVFDDRFEH